MPRKLNTPVTLFAAIETRQHEALREIAFHERRSLADVVRQALDEFIASHGRQKKSRVNVVRREKTASMR
jgi:hypothetical protein